MKRRSGVSPAFREKYPHFPWKEMAGMRDRLIHGYFDVNLDVVWQTVTTNLPPLIAEPRTDTTLELDADARSVGGRKARECPGLKSESGVGASRRRSFR